MRQHFSCYNHEYQKVELIFPGFSGFPNCERKLSLRKAALPRQANLLRYPADAISAFQQLSDYRSGRK